MDCKCFREKQTWLYTLYSHIVRYDHHLSPRDWSTFFRKPACSTRNDGVRLLSDVEQFDSSIVWQIYTFTFKMAFREGRICLLLKSLSKDGSTHCLCNTWVCFIYLNIDQMGVSVYTVHYTEINSNQSREPGTNMQTHIHTRTHIHTHTQGHGVIQLSEFNAMCWTIACITDKVLSLKPLALT